MLNNIKQRELQEFLQKKQLFIKRAIDALNKGDSELAIKNVNIDTGFNISIIKLLEEVN